MLHTITLFSLITSFLIVGCGSSSDHHSAPSSSSSSNSSGSSISNLGNPMNTLGYYGENVLLGSTSIVGEWEIEGTYIVESFSFKEDGSGTFASDGEIQTSDVPLSYGVNEDGKQLTITITQNDPITYTCLKFENACCYINDDEALCKTAP